MNSLYSTLHQSAQDLIINPPFCIYLQMRYRNSSVNTFARLILKSLSEDDNGKSFKCEVTQEMKNGTILKLTRTFDINVNGTQQCY